jgi:hypothetical protein
MQLADLPLLAGTISHYHLRPQMLALCKHTLAKKPKVDVGSANKQPKSPSIAE